MPIGPMIIAQTMSCFQFAGAPSPREMKKIIPRMNQMIEPTIRTKFEVAILKID